MDAFDLAMEHAFGFEGGYVNDPVDKGGPTNFGITLATLKAALGDHADLDLDGDVDADDVRKLTRDQAKEIYRERYWNRPGIWAIADPRVQSKVFDVGINCGPRTAIALLQKAINVARPASRVGPVEVDGVLGAQTLTALDRCDEDVLLGALCAEQRCFYLKVVEHDPKQKRFLSAWLRRAAWPLDEKKGA